MKYIISAHIPTEKAYGHEDVKMCEIMSKAGINVELISPRSANSVKNNIFEFYGLEENFSVKYLTTFNYFSIFRNFERFGFYVNWFCFFLRLVFLKTDADAVIFTRMPEIAWLYKKKKHKVIYECHEWFGRSEKLALYLLRNCDHIITTNRFIKQKFADAGFAGKKILVATNGVDLEKFRFELFKEEAADELNLDTKLNSLFKSKTILLYAGSFKTMNVDKGINEILRAMKILDNNNLFFLAIGGNEPDLKYYRDMAEKLGVEKQCSFIGRRNQTELALWQKAADILLAPFPDKAHYRYFMTPLKLFEYMAAKRPIVASDLPSIREIMNDKNCLFCHPGDAEDLAAKIKKLLQDKDFGKKLAEQAFEDVKNYSWERRVEKILNFIIA
ncbi:MAG: glycosyltransferase family 4 protein [Candidatus Falkowbacteria bacterium]